jgi:hypothetical protein
VIYKKSSIFGVGCLVPTPNIVTLVSPAYVNWLKKSIFNNTKLLRPDLGLQAQIGVRHCQAATRRCLDARAPEGRLHAGVTRTTMAAKMVELLLPACSSLAAHPLCRCPSSKPPCLHGGAPPCSRLRHALGSCCCLLEPYWSRSCCILSRG